MSLHEINKGVHKHTKPRRLGRAPERRFPPPPAFAAQAHVRDHDVYERADRDFEEFWAGFARELEWQRPWDRVLDWQPPHAR